MKRVKVLGPADKSLGATKLDKLETTWLPMLVDEGDFEELKREGLLHKDEVGNVLKLSFPSMSLDKEMRFRLNRALVSDGDAWSAAGLGGHLGEDSIEILASAQEPLTWTENDWPREAGVKSADWGHSLRCLSFKDQAT